MGENESQFEGKLLSHSLLLVVTTGIASAAAVVFHMIMGRRLEESEYGILAALLNMMLVLSTPLDALRNAMAQFAARAHRANDPALVRAIAWRWCLRIGLLSLPLSLALWLLHGPIAGFFHLQSPGPVLIVALCLPPFMLLPVAAGILQGIQRFWIFSASMHGMALIRLALGYGFVALLGATAFYAVLAHGLATLYGALAAILSVWWITRGAGPAVKATRGIGPYFLGAMFMLGAYGILMNCDVMIVRHFYPNEADAYAWAATIGRSVVFLPMPIAMAMFPKVISSGASSRSSRLILLKALGMVSAMIGAGVAVCLLWPKLPLLILYGIRDPAPELLHLVRMTMLAMCPLGITYLLLNFEMAQHRFGTVPWLALLAVAYVVGVWRWHGSVLAIVGVLGTVATASAVLYLWALLRPGRPAAAAAPAH